MVDVKSMTDKEALSWLMQPGIQATLYGYDRHTNGALKRAINALKRKVETEQNKTKTETDKYRKVYSKDNDYFYTFTKNGTKVDSSFFDWCCMRAEVRNYQEQEGMSEKEAYEKFWNAVSEYDKEKYDRIIGKYDNLDEAVGDGSLDELRIDYIESLYEFIEEE